ncbi:MAG: diphosphomevalonate decarboxylase [Aggregatilineales bacterium]
MNKATAIAHSNLAFLKYWGKVDRDLNLPVNNSISMNLSEAKTITTVEFDEGLTSDEIFVVGQDDGVTPSFMRRTTKHLDRVRALAKIETFAKVSTHNTFPTGIGIASSASGMAALTLAATFALGLDLSEPQLSALARLGSGSACRSIPGGFVEWLAGSTHATSYAVQIAPPDHWDIVDIAVAVSQKEKAVSSTDGHELAEKSPFFQARLATLADRLNRIRAAILECDFETFGQEIEAEAISFHAVAMTSPNITSSTLPSGIYYWLPSTLDLMLSTHEWRQDGLPVYFTLDAGPTVHLVCRTQHRDQVINAVLEQEKASSHLSDENWTIFVNRPARGAYVSVKGATYSQ